MPERPAVTTHRLDAHDAPGGTDLAEQLLDKGDQVAAGAVHPAGVLVDHLGLHFPARPGSQQRQPTTAEVARREPWTAPQIQLEIPPDSPMHNVDSAGHVLPDPVRPGEPSIAVPWRRLVVLGHYRQAAQVTLDGGGLGTIDLTPTSSVPLTHAWLLDRVVGRMGAQGAALVYAGAPGNDQDLLAQASASALAFAFQADGNAIELRQGWRLTVSVLGGGAAAVGTAVAYYRLCQWVAGQPEPSV